MQQRNLRRRETSTCGCCLLLTVGLWKPGTFQGQPLLVHACLGCRCCSQEVRSAPRSACRKERREDVIIGHQAVLHTSHLPCYNAVHSGPYMKIVVSHT